MIHFEIKQRRIRRVRNVNLFLPCVLALLLLAGCGGKKELPVFPVRGKVLDASGKPAAGAIVVFHPLGASDPNRPKPTARVGASSPFRDGIDKARKAFEAKCHVTTKWQHPNMSVVVTGIGFFDVPHGQTLPALNHIEFHPVLGIVDRIGKSGGATRNQKLHLTAAACSVFVPGRLTGWRGTITLADDGEGRLWKSATTVTPKLDCRTSMTMG